MHGPDAQWEAVMKHAYIIHAARGRETKQLPCASTWVAVERRNLLNRQGWKVRIVNHAGAAVSDSLLEATAQAEVEAAVARKPEAL